MSTVSYSTTLERNRISDEIKHILTSFESQCSNVTFKKGIYIYGSPGCGKTHFIDEILKSLDYDIIKYDAGDVRNRALIDTITSNNISNRNVLHMMSRRVKKIAIVMDEIDGMNNGDKGGINALIKLIRQKKTKKQKLENVTMNPIICIGNYYVDKKIKELIKVCNVFELKPPTQTQMSNLLTTIIPGIDPEIKLPILNYIQGDLRKMSFVHNIYNKKPHLLNADTLQSVFQMKSYNDDAKHITRSLIQSPASIDQHHLIMNDTDRTIVALLWHENIADMLDNIPISKSFPFYLTILDNMCFADYIDRITFQNQIWLFNEMSSLIKTWNNNQIYHDTFPENRGKCKISDIRFTKVLTKYSTEYNNTLFIYNMTQEMDMDKKDMIAFFQEMRLFFGKMDQKSSTNEKSASIETQMEELFETLNISKLDIRRIYRYLDKNVKKDSALLSIDDLDDLDDFDDI